MITLTIEATNPVAQAALEALAEHTLHCTSASIDAPMIVALKLVIGDPLKSEGERPDAKTDNQEMIHHKHDNIAATVQQPRDDLLTDEPQGPMPPYGRALGDLMEDPATKDVARLLIAPLLEQGLRINGNPATVLNKAAREFKEQPASKLCFAARWLLKGKHELFPDFEEIYAAIGRYKPTPKPSAADPAAHVNRVQV